MDISTIPKLEIQHKALNPDLHLMTLRIAGYAHYAMQKKRNLNQCRYFCRINADSNHETYQLFGQLKMLINEINKFCAKHGRLTYTFIGIVIIIPFVFLYGDFGGTLQGGSSRNPKMGVYYGKSITRKNFLDNLKAIRVNFYLEYQRYLPANNDQVIKALSQEVLNRMRALYKAKQLGIDHVTPEEIQEKIMNYPSFLEAEKFDRKKFDEFRDDYLNAENLSAQEFDHIVKENIIVDRIEKQVTESLITPQTEARAFYVENYTKCKAHVSTFYSFKYQGEIEVSEEELEEYFNTNLETTYRVPEQKQIQVAVFDSNKHMDIDEIEEQELKAYYDERKADDYTKNQIRLKHVFIRTSSDESNDAKQEKKDKLTEILKELNGGADFDEIIETHSEDVATAGKGGDLGYMDKDVIKNRYGADFEKLVSKLPINDFSDVIESKSGYHLVRKLDERDSIPFTEVRDEIKTVLQENKDEAMAKEYYDENRETDYSKEEVHARHILIKIDPDDSEEVKSEKRQKLEGILKEAREKKNFYELAKLHSEDASNSGKGGDLGYFGKGQMVKPFEEAVFSMEKGDISDIVETRFGFHILEKIDDRNSQPFSEVKTDIVNKLNQEKKDKAKEIASEEATKFAVEAHGALADIPNENKAQSFVEFCKDYTQSTEPISPIKSGFFTPEDYTIPNIERSNSTVVKEASKLGRENALSEVIESGDFYYVACWQASKDSYLPKFKATKDDASEELVLTKQAKKAERDLKNERGIAKAVEECRKAYEEIKTKLEEGTSFDEAKGELAFTATGEFPLAQGPRIANGEIIKSEAGKVAANTIIAPKETSQGALLIYVESHSLPTEEDYEKIKSYWLPQFEQRQQQTALASYYKELEKESNTQISEEWQFLFEQEEPEESADDS